MKNSYIIIPIAVFFIILFFFYLKKEKGFTHITFVLFLWMISSVAGVLYAFSDLLYISKSLPSILAAFFFVISFFIAIQPVVNIKQLNRSNYYYPKDNLLDLLIIILALSSILPFCENLVQLLHGSNLQNIGTNYDEREAITNFDPRAHMSWLGARLNSLTIFTKYITAFLLFHYLSTKRNKKWWVIAGLVMGCFNPSISFFFLGSRWPALEDIFFIFMLFLLYKKILGARTKYVFSLLMISIVVVLSIATIYITITRFGESDYSISNWLYRYMGEGYYNFIGDMWNINNNTYGKHIFRGVIGETSETLFRITNIRMYVFYTFVGDLYADFGPILTIIIISLFSFYFIRLAKKKKYSFFDVIYLSLYYNIPQKLDRCIS